MGVSGGGEGSRDHTGTALECQPVGPVVGRMSVSPGRDALSVMNKWSVQEMCVVIVWWEVWVWEQKQGERGDVKLKKEAKGLDDKMAEI